jgi:transcriptional regulator with XRE-family HTH domain
MTIKRVQRKVERTPQEQARIDALRAKFERERPGPDQLAASGEYEGPVQAGAYWEVRRVMTELKAERERQGLTLAQLAECCGIDKGAISKLETGRQVNPTVDTLSRIATGLGLTLGVTLRNGTEPSGQEPPGDQALSAQTSAETGPIANPQKRSRDPDSDPSPDEAQRFVNCLVACQAKVASSLADALNMPGDFLADQARRWQRYFHPYARPCLPTPSEQLGGNLNEADDLEPLLTFDMNGRLAFRCSHTAPADLLCVQQVLEKYYR